MGLRQIFSRPGTRAAPGPAASPARGRGSQARRSDLRHLQAWSAQAARDRLSSTTFLAALVHGILILGITFGAGSLSRESEQNSLEVVIVTSQFEDRTAPADAVLLAQKNLEGAGNAPVDSVVRTQPGLDAEDAPPGPVQEGADSEVRPGQFDPFARPSPVLLARESRLRAPDEGERDRAAEQQRSTLHSDANAIDIVGRIDDITALPDQNPRELLVSANTRESRIATYLSSWKRRVEQIGTQNFPAAMLRTGESAPVLEVAIGADGELRDVIIKTTSGERGVDSAAIEILRMAAPFQPFPERLRDDYDVLRFAYEWRFSDGSATVRARTAAVM